MRRAIGLVGLLIIAGLRVAEACTCYDNPPCAAVWRAEAVFVGTVVERGQEPIGGTISWTVTHVAVNQQLHGSLDSFITLVPSASLPTVDEITASTLSGSPLESMSTCDYRFETGRQYLIYARRTNDGRWTTSMCSGTKPLEGAAGDLEYLAGIPNAPLTGRVYGRIERIVVDPADPMQTIAVPVAGIQVELARGSDRLTVSTDSQGRLDVQVPPGDYRIAPIVPQTIRVYGAPFETPVPARGCATVQFGVISNGRIEGRVLEQNGSPVRRAQVDAVPSDLPPGQRPDGMTSPSGTTDDKGEFQIDAVLPGRYVVAVNARFGPGLTSPYATTYLPGVARDQAEVIDIGDGERKTGFTIVVAPLAEASIAGIVMFGEKPAADAELSAAPFEYRGTSMNWTKTDSNGRFTLHVLAGMTYRITAGVRDGDRYRRVETVVAADEQNDDISLSIPR